MHCRSTTEWVLSHDEAMEMVARIVSLKLYTDLQHTPDKKLWVFYLVSDILHYNAHGSHLTGSEVLLAFEKAC